MYAVPARVRLELRRNCVYIMFIEVGWKNEMYLLRPLTHISIESSPKKKKLNA